MSRSSNKMPWIVLGLIIILAVILLGITQCDGPPVDPHFEELEYDTDDSYVKGKISGVENPRDYKLLVMIHTPASQQFWVKPELDTCLFDQITEDGRFAIRAFTPNEPDDKKADKFVIYLLPKSFRYVDIPEDTSVMRFAFDNAKIISEERNIVRESEPPPPPPPPPGSGEARLESVTYNETDFTVEGKIDGDASNCYLILFIRVAGQYWVKPDYAAQLSPISDDNSFRIRAYTPGEHEGTDKTADAYILYLVRQEPGMSLTDMMVDSNAYESVKYIDKYEGRR